MDKLQYQIKNQRVIDLDTVMEVRTLVNQGDIGISGYEVTRSNGQKFEVCLPCIQQVVSEIEIIQYIKLVCESHEASINDIVLMAEVLPNYGHSNKHNGKDTILIAIAEGKQVFDVQYLPEHQTSIVDALEQMNKSDLEGYLNTFIDERFRVSFQGVDSGEFFMPYYSLTVDLKTNGLSLDEIKNKVESNFEALDTKCENGKVVFWCYAGEGPFVDTMQDILWVIMELFGLNITETLTNIGIQDYQIDFQVSEYLC